MPELPEVQTVVNQLERKIVGKTIRGFWTEWAKAVRPTPEVFESVIVGAKVVGIRRFGKHIVIDLRGGKESLEAREQLFSRLPFGALEPAPHPDVEKSSLSPLALLADQDYISIVIHLKMTGHLLVKDAKNRKSEEFRDPYNQFIHHIFTLSGGTTVEFSDMRKFGWLEVMPTATVEQLKSVRTLGVDALSRGFTDRYFDSILDKKLRQKIGVILLDQGLIAGIGNIYRSEALFVAGILPDRTVATLSRAERVGLLKAIKFVLRRAIRYRGTSDGDFRDTDGRPGGFQRRLGVYAREGEPCPTCGTIVQRSKLGQRSIFFCPKCQK